MATKNYLRESKAINVYNGNKFDETLRFPLYPISCYEKKDNVSTFNDNKPNMQRACYRYVYGTPS